MKVTAEEYNLLKIVAEDLFKSDNYDKRLKVKVKNVDQDTGAVYTYHHTEGTKSAILVELLKKAECGEEPICDVASGAKHNRPADTKKDKADSKPDPHTEKELEQRGAAPTPDFNTLKAPAMSDVLRKKPAADNAATLVPPRIEGEIWKDENDRWWKMENGKKRQQKKPKT